MPFFYSTNLKTQPIDPISDINNQKIEFRFAEDTAYYPNIRLYNLAVVTITPRVQAFTAASSISDWYY